MSIPRRFSSLAKPSVLCEHPLRYWMPLSAYANQMVEFGIRPAIALWRGCLVYAELYPKDDAGNLCALKPLRWGTGDRDPRLHDAKAAQLQGGRNDTEE